jgi:hypothetical protein
LLVGASILSACALVVGIEDHHLAPAEETGAAPSDASTHTAVDGGEETSTAPITFVRAAANLAKNSSRVTVTLPSVAAHRALVVALDHDTSSSLVSVTDNAGDIFATVLGPIDSTFRHYILLALDVSGMPGDRIITVTLDTPTSVIEVYGHEYANFAQTGAFDRGDGASGTALGLMQSPPIITTAPNELIFGFGTAGGAKVGTGFTGRSVFDSNVTEDRIAGPPGSYAATATAVAVGGSWTMLVAAFKGR